MLRNLRRTQDNWKSAIKLYGKYFLSGRQMSKQAQPKSKPHDANKSLKTYTALIAIESESACLCCQEEAA